MSKILYPSQQKYLNSFRYETDNLILSMEKYAETYNVPILNWQAAELLEQLILIKNPERVLEIGTAIAYSSIRIARKLKSNGKVDTIEKSKDNIKIAEKNISVAGLKNKIRLLKGDALTIMKNLKNKYDLIFLDADKEDYEKLFSYSLNLMSKNSVLFVDNMLWHGYAAAEKVPLKYKTSTEYIKRFNKIFMNDKTLDSTIIPIGDGIGIGIKK